MEKIEEIETRCIEYEHNFFCDKCGMSLGSTTESDDGYYNTIGEFSLSFSLPDGWYKIEKCFCDKCREDFIKLLKTKLIDMGFEKDK